MLTKYIQAAMYHAHNEILPDDGTVYGEITILQGVWANADTGEACRDELQVVREDWLLLKIADHDALPTVDGISLTIAVAA